MLNERSKSLLAKLSKERLDKYEEVLRNYLLREFKLRPTPEQYRDRFWSAVKQPEETYTLFGSRAITLFQHYLDSRKVVSKDDVIDLLVADRIKQTLPGDCLRHVLSAGGSDWFKPDRLTHVIDVYMSSNLNFPRNAGLKPPRVTGWKPTTG